MNFDLLLLSGQIALLVLMAAIMAACITWLVCRGQAQAARKVATEAEARIALAEEQAAAARAITSATEQQCIAALEQRDEAERHALEHAGEARRATEQIAVLHRDQVPRADHEQTLARLADLEARHHDAEAAFSRQLGENQDRLDGLKAEHDAALVRLQQAEAATHQKGAEVSQLESQLTALRAELKQLNADHLGFKTQHEAIATELTAARESSARLKVELDEAQFAKLEVEENLGKQLDDLRAQLAKGTSDLERHRLALEEVTGEKIRIEQELKARVQHLTQELSHRPHTVSPPSALIAPPAAAPPPRIVPAIAPPIITPPVAAEEPESFPMAPSRITLRDSLFRESDITSLPPDQPNLDDARQLLARMEAELDEKEQLLTALQRDLDQRQQSLDDLLREEPEATDKHKASRKRIAEAEHRLATALDERDRSRRHVRAVGRSLAIIDAHSSRPDNLMLIKGVKTVLNSQLHAYGIFTYRQIAAWDADDMQAFSELLSFKQRITRDKWQEQARQLHEARHGERLS